MIIDEILDRRDGCEYDPEYLVDTAKINGFDNVVKAFESKDENAAKSALKDYVRENEYSDSVCDYIDSQQWIV